MDKLAEVKKVFDIEIAALEKMKNALDETFIEILNMVVACEGKVVITGMGKQGHIAGKLSATLSSLGTQSFFLHPAEALHGDLGMLSEKDVVIAISYSGESEEITRMLPSIKMIGAKIIAISGNADSTLVKHSDVSQILPDFDEACMLGLAPTSSTTVTMCYGDALSIVASKTYGFRDTDFGVFHPAGSLGKKLLLKVQDLMKADSDNAFVYVNSTLKETIVELSKKGLGIVSIINLEKDIVGVITDGDLRRLLEKGIDVYGLPISKVMTKNPVLIREDVMAVEALQILKLKNVSSMPVVNKENKLIGTIRMQSIVKAGILLKD